MKLQYPFLAFFITSDDKLACLHARKPEDISASGDPQTFSTSLHLLEAEGLDAAYTRVGQMVLPALSVYHPETWLRFPNLRPFHPEERELALITDLTSKLIRSKNKALIPVIQTLVDELVQREPEMANEATIETWPDTRAQIEQRSL